MEAFQFFDHNATTPLRAEARAAWCEAADSYWLNPSSPYRAASRVRVRLDAAREQLAGLLEVAVERLVFNSGATEGNNTVFAHWARTLPAGSRVGVSPTEHPSVIEAAKVYLGPRVVWLDLDDRGQVDPVELERRLEAGELAAISVMAANNETGVLNPWERIARAARVAGVSMHCDASQWIGKLAPTGLGACDWLTGCGHKFGGPRGTGFLVGPESGAAYVGLYGGAQEAGHRAGTEDVAGVVATVAALAAAETERGVCNGQARDGFERALRTALPEVAIIAGDVARLWNTVSLVVPEFASVRWIRGLEKRGFLVSAGAACSTGKAGPSPVLAAMGVDSAAMRRVLRISSGWRTTEADWSALCGAMVEVYDALRSEDPGAGTRVISI